MRLRIEENQLVGGGRGMQIKLKQKEKGEERDSDK